MAFIALHQATKNPTTIYLFALTKFVNQQKYRIFAVGIIIAALW